MRLNKDSSGMIEIERLKVTGNKKDIDFEEIIDVPWNTNTLTGGINPLGKVPILLCNAHEPLFDSKLIK